MSQKVWLSESSAETSSPISMPRNQPGSPPLNEHVLEEIFSIVYDTSYSTIKSLLLTSRLFHELTLPLIYRYIGINAATDSFEEEVESWLVDPEQSAIPKAIRHISIYSEKIYFGFQRAEPKQLPQHPSRQSMRVIGKPPPWRKYNHDDDETDFSEYRDREGSKWSMIAGLVSQTTQLRSLTFSCPEAIPLVLLQAIHNNPSDIHLNIASWTPVSSGMLHTDIIELALLGSPSLRSLQANIRNPEYNAEDLRLPAFWRLVRSAPNLRSARLSISYRGCVIRGYSAQEIQAWKDVASKFERTTLSHGDHPSGIRNLRITGADLSRFQDRELSRLTTLDCSTGLPLQIFHSLKSLTHLILRGKYTNAIDDLLIACRPLTLLSVFGWKKCLHLDTILTHHGYSLRALALHEFERNDYVNPREVLLNDELVRLRDGLPHLEELSIDLNIPEDLENPIPNHLSTDIHQEVYNILSTFPYLLRLQLNYNLGISSFNKSNRLRFGGLSHQSVVPFIDEGFVQGVWEASRTAVIQELRIAQGESERPIGRGYPAAWVTWEQTAHQWFKATRSERDDEPDKIIISMHRDVPDFTDDLWRECRW